MNFDYVKSLPGLISVKDRNSLAVGLSQEMSTLLGCKKPEHFYGKTDYDIPCKAVEFADQFVK